MIDTQTDEVVGSPIPVSSVWQLAITPAQAPVASFTATTAAGAPVTFDASASASASASGDPGGQIGSYAWSFGDGQSEVTTGPSLTHVYAAPGTYRATLTLTGADGCSTTFVFTGQTALCNGSSRAVQTRTVTAAAAAPAAGPVAAAPALVAVVPAKVKLTKVKLNERRGTAVVLAQVSGPGSLVLTGKGLVKAKATSRGVGVVKLVVKAKGRAKKLLVNKGSARVKATVRSRSQGGTAVTATRSIVLKMKPRRNSHKPS